ncbi:MAG: NUDIX domain-containing protein [Erythrobacter sp.]|nr:NUDIX domain-containing protein [Erythrobacter sp.]
MESESPIRTNAEPNGIPAATIIIFRNAPIGKPPEILMTVRARSLTFAGGMAVFPGGRVDPADYDLARKVAQGPDHDHEELAHQVAAIRETLEETGLALGFHGEITAHNAREARRMLGETGALAPVLDAFGWRLDFDQIVPFARWFPKNDKLPRLYDTRFYLADLGTGAVDVSIDAREATRLFWTSAKGALEMAAASDIKLIFPTRRNLERLALFEDFAAARAQAEAIPVRTIVPKIDDSSGQPMLTIMRNAGYPVTEELLQRAARG